MEREDTPPDIRPSLVLLRRARAADDALAEVTSRYGTNPDQWLALELLVRRGRDGLSMTELRAATGLTGATLTRTVDKLIKDALAFREVDALDRRRVVVFASAEGTDLYTRSKDAVDEAERSLDPATFDAAVLPAHAEHE